MAKLASPGSKIPTSFHRLSANLFNFPGLSGPLLHLFLFDLKYFFFECPTKGVHTRNVASFFSKVLRDPWILEIHCQMYAGIIVAFFIQLVTG